MASSGETEARLRARFEKWIERTNNRLAYRTRKMHRKVKALEEKGRLSPEEVHRLQMLIYDFQMEHAHADSVFGMLKLRTVEAAASLRRSLFQQLHRNELQPWPFQEKRLSLDLMSKRLSQLLMSRLGARIPESTEVMSLTAALDRIRHDPPFPYMALKPLDSSGSKGVFLIRETEIFQAKGSLTLESIDDVEREARHLIEIGKASEKNWYIEEGIPRADGKPGPPRDLKFFCFYGKVALVLEIDRSKSLNLCYWTPDGKRTKGVRGYATFEGAGFEKEQLEFAEELSGRIPLPRTRLDFLDGADGMVFGEMSVGGGNFERFPRPQDRRLGEYILDAEGRLYLDMLRGKQFPEFMETALEYPAFREMMEAPVPTGSQSVRPVAPIDERRD